jgi:hypothetical protein
MITAGGIFGHPGIMALAIKDFSVGNWGCIL